MSMNIQASPKILLLADYSNFHNTLAKGLRRLGCSVTVISDGATFMDCDRDIDISRRPGVPGGLMLFLRLLGPLHKYLRGYDIVSLRNTSFLELRPERTLWFFRRLRRDNPNIFMTALTTDIPFLDMLEAKDSPLSYSEWFVNGKPNRLMEAEPESWDAWHTPALQRLNDEIFSNIDGAVSALYEYQLSMLRRLGPELTVYGGIPVETRDIEFRPLDRPGKIRIFLGRDRNRKLIKGSDMLECAARDVCSRHPDLAELVIIENVSRDLFFKTMRSCHLVLDQIYSYTPATTALEAMAMGLNVISGAEPEFYSFINENELRPVINAPVDYEALRDTIERTVLHPELFAERSLKGRKFVERHNDTDIVASRFLNFWLSRLEKKGYLISGHNGI